MPLVGDRVSVLGVRHHGPGSARSVLRALDQLDPATVVVEGPPELDGLLGHVDDPDLVPPVAALVYAVGEPRRASFYPLASFSPEWVALRWAAARGRTVRFADLPATHSLAPAPESRDGDDQLDSGADGESGDEGDGGEAARWRRPDPLATLARLAGYDDPERWWEDAVEHRADSPVEAFALITEAMHGVRAGVRTDPETARREAAMRRVVRSVLRADRDGEERVAVVCGAYHAPVLHPDSFPTAKADTALLTGLPKVKVTATWVPWTADRLAFDSGYGAGVTSPGWYAHVFDTWLAGDADAAAATATDDPRAGRVDPVSTSWLVRVAHELRRERLDASPASLVEATRLADALAAVRGRPAVGLAELTDATQAVLCEGSELPLRLLRRRLVVGEGIGRVPDRVPTVPLAADLAREQRAVRLPPKPGEQRLELDLRRDAGRARSRLFHRLDLLGIAWARAASTEGSLGTFKESWVLQWSPELAVAVVEASVHGTTVLAATESRVREQAATLRSLPELADLTARCLVAELPGALEGTVAALAGRTADQHDVTELLGALAPLARTRRYGDVRGIDTAGVGGLLETMVARVCAGLRSACLPLDDEGADTMRGLVDGAHQGLALLVAGAGDGDQGASQPALLGLWLDALTGLAEDERIPGAVSGRAHRLLLDAGRLGLDEAARRMARRLSAAAPAPAAAAWLDAFVDGDVHLLLHDDTVLDLVDDWVAGIADPVFDDLLPLLRRTFSRFEPAERRRLGERISRARSSRRTADVDTPVDLGDAVPAARALADVMGLVAR